MYVVLLLKDCPYCHAAEDLLKKHDLSYESFVFHDKYIHGKKLYDKKVFKKKFGDNATFPRIYRNKKYIGGYNDLKKILKDDEKK